MSLGWLTESSVQPKRAKLIAGVDSGSLLDLRAAFYQKESEYSAKSIKLPTTNGESGTSGGALSGFLLQQKHAPVTAEGKSSRSKAQRPVPQTLMSDKNRGVEQRSLRDQVVESSGDRTQLLALQKKAEIYDKLASGKAVTLVAGKGTKRKNPLIDFERKVWEQEETNRTRSFSSDETETIDLRQEQIRWQKQALNETEVEEHTKNEKNKKIELPTTTNTLRSGLGFDGVVSGGLRFKGDRMNATPSSGVLYTQAEKDTLLQMTNETLSARDRLTQYKDNRKQATAHKKQLLLKKKQKNLLLSSSSLSSLSSSSSS